MVTPRVYCPAASEAPLTETCTVDGVAPEGGVALSQLPPLKVLPTTVKFKGTGLPLTGEFISLHLSTSGQLSSLTPRRSARTRPSSARARFSAALPTLSAAPSAPPGPC